MSSWKRSGNVTTCTHSTQVDANAASSGPKDETTRIRGWAGRPPAGYVTIGSIRYGVRFASNAPTTPPMPPTPSRGAAPSRAPLLSTSDASNHDADCCCGVVPLSWPRTGHSPPPPPSRLPIPSTLGEKPQTIIRRNMFSRLNTGELSSRIVSSRVETVAPRAVPAPPVPAPPVQPSPVQPLPVQVYKSTLEWCSVRKAAPRGGGVRSCFSAGEDDTEPEDGGLKMVKERVVPSSPLRRRILVRSKPELPSYLKACANSSTESLLQFQPDGGTARSTLDRLNRFRFGAGAASGAERKDAAAAASRTKKKRSSDKTERLKELTEKLKSPSASTSTSASPERGVSEQEVGQAIAVSAPPRLGRLPTLERAATASKTHPAPHQQKQQDQQQQQQQQQLGQPPSGVTTNPKFGRQPTYSNQSRNKYQQNLKQAESHKTHPPLDEQRRLTKQRNVVSPPLSSPDRSNYQQRIEENLRFQQELALQEELQFAEECAGLVTPCTRSGAAPAGSSMDPTPTPTPTPASVTCTVTVGGAEKSAAPEVVTTVVEDESSDDLFFLHRPESRTIVGSYTQSKIPYRSASFSQVDYSQVDGKYVRNANRTSPYGGYTTAPSGSHTLPRKRLPDIESVSSSVSPSTSLSGVEQATAEPTPEEVYKVNVAKLVDAFSGDVVSKTRTCPTPLFSRGDFAEEIPFTSPMEDEGLMFASSVPPTDVQEVAEESLAPSEEVATLTSAPLVGDNSTPLAEETTKDEGVAVIPEECVDHNAAGIDDRTEVPISDDVFNADVLGDDRTETVQDLSSPWLFALQHNDLAIAPCNSENYQSAEIEKQKKYPVIAKSTVVFQADIVSVDVFSDKSVDNNPADNVISAEADGLTQTSEGGSFIAEWPTGHDESSKPTPTPTLTPTPTPKPRRDDEIDYSKECVRQCEEWLKELGEDFQLQQKQNVKSVQETGGDDEQHGDLEAQDSCPDTIQCLAEDDHEEYKVASITKVELQRSAPLQIERSETEKEKQPQIANEVAIITTPPQWTDDKRWSGEGTDSDRNNDWGSPSEEPQTPEEMGQRPQWPSASETRRWPLVYQSSDEREDETPNLSQPSPKRYLTVRADSFSEGESEGGEIRPRTPTRGERDRNTSPSLLTPTEEFDSRSGGIGVVHEARTVHVPRRYSKRPLRGPYGQMLEAEMKKPETSRIFSKLNYNDDLKVFLEEYRPTSPPPGTPSPDTLRPTSDPRLAPRRSLATHSLDDSQLKGGYGRSSSVSVPATGDRRTSPKRKVNASIPFPMIDPEDSGLLMACHQRTTSSPSTLDGHTNVSPRGERLRPEPTPELLAELLRGSSERLSTSTSAINGTFLQDTRDTRTHVVVELYDTERNYVEALQILVMKYLQPLKSPENAGLVDASLVDEIFYQVPAILQHHEHLLDELRKRLDNWDINQKIGDVFLEAFTRQPVIETYTAFINNWKSAKEAIKATCQAKPAFARFIEAMAREHKGKLALDCLLIKPVQRIPRYELLIQRLLKHTDQSHPDHVLLLEAQKEVHELAVKINCTERESLEYEQQQNTLKELENIIEGSINLVSSERVFIRHDMVSMVSGQGTRKERALFLFSDLLVITSVKRRSGTIRKPSATCPGSVASTLEANKYKLLMRVPLDDLEIVKTKDENLKKRLREMENLSEDIVTLNQVTELCSALHCPHSQLEEIVKDMLNTASKQLEDQRTTDSQLSYLELTVNTQSGMDNVSVVFTKAEKRNWEESFNEAKQKLADRRPSPEFVLSVPIRKTRAGLQFTCAAPTLGLNASNMRDVWVCNSDGYVGQVCVLSLTPEPTVISCNGVCNARILCVASVPAGITGPTASTTLGQPPFTSNKIGISISVEDTDKSGGNIQLDSSSSSSDDDEPDDERPPRIAPPEDELKRARSASDSVLSSDRDPSTALSSAVPASQPDDTDSLQPTMWLGTEDGCIHVYNCTDNIRIKKNKVKIQHGSSVHCIIYLDNRVFVALANGDITVYIRDHSGWNTTDPYTVSVGTASMPVSRMLPVAGKLWCGCHNSIKILNTFSLEVEHSFVVNADMTRSVTWLATAGLGAWVSLHNSAIVRLFHATTYECLTEVNVAPAVNKMLASCDDIIRQHKAACLRVTSLLACKDLLWIGTSAGVVLTMSLPHIAPSTTKLAIAPSATGVPHGHTGHVRFLTVVDTLPSPAADGLVLRPNTHHRYSLKTKPDLAATAKLLVISGGDGYEDFRTSSASEVAGREDSTNHLLIWHV